MSFRFAQLWRGGVELRLEIVWKKPLNIPGRSTISTNMNKKQTNHQKMTGRGSNDLSLACHTGPANHEDLEGIPTSTDADHDKIGPGHRPLHHAGRVPARFKTL